MHRKCAVVVTATTIAALLGACADAPTAPAHQDVPPVSVPQSRIIIDHMAEDQSSADFTVTPSGGYFELGRHGIFFPADAICDPRTSTYGPTEWDKPCQVLREPIRIHAEMRFQDGRHWVDFSPELRFAPSRNWKEAVYIYMSAEKQPRHQEIRPDHRHVAESTTLTILWSPYIGAPGIDESVEDRSLRTFEHKPTGFVFRRIKHFSGYNVRDRSDL